MNNPLKLAAGLWLAALVPAFAGSDGNVMISADNPAIRYNGRIDFSNPAKPRFDWPEISISAAFTGKSIGVILEDGGNNYNAFIDGQLNRVIVTTTSATNYFITGLPDGQHTLLLTKRTSEDFGMGTFDGLILEPGQKLADLPPAPGRKIEVLGDSFTVGYGDEGPETCGDLRPYENSYLSYAAITARALDAQDHIIAASGTGLVRNWAAPGVTSPNPMPSYYDRTVKSIESTNWDFSKWIPDAVVINLGTNDYSTQPQAEHDTYVQRYRELIARIRGHYPGVPVFCMGQPLFASNVKDVVDQENASGDKNVYLVNYTNNAANGYGCSGHPSLKTHQEIADALVKAMRAALGW